MRQSDAWINGLNRHELHWFLFAEGLYRGNVELFCQRVFATDCQGRIVL